MTLRARAAVAVAVALVVAAPFVIGTFGISLLDEIGMASLVALGLVMLTGVGGVTSFGQAAFVGLAAYTSAWLTKTYDVSPWLGLVAALIAGTLGAIACFALYYVATAFTLSYGTKTLGYAMTQMLLVQLGAILFMALGIFLSAWMADRRWDERRVLIGGCAGVIVAGFLMQPMLGSGSLALVFAYLALVLLLMGFVYGPLGAWLPSLFPPRVRYTGVSMAFNIAGVLGGGLTPLFAQALATHYGLWAVGAYGSAAAALSLVALLAVGARRGVAERLLVEP